MIVSFQQGIVIHTCVPALKAGWQSLGMGKLALELAGKIEVRCTTVIVRIIGLFVL